MCWVSRPIVSNEIEGSLRSSDVRWVTVPSQMESFAGHSPLIAVMLCLTVGLPRGHARVQETLQNLLDSAVPTKGVDTGGRPDEPQAESLTADEAVRLAVEALDRLDSRESDVDKDALLAEARRYAESARQRDPANPWLYYLSGRYFAHVGRQGDAIEQLRKFVETREGRNQWRAYVTLANLFVGDYPQLAKVNYEKAQALNSSEPDILLGLSTCAAKLGASEEAIARAREAIALDGRKTPLYMAHLARLLLAADRLDDAQEAADAARDLAEHWAQGHPGRLRPLQTLDRQYQLLIEILQQRVARDRQAQVQDSNVGGPAPVADYLRLAELQRARGKLADKFAKFAALAALEAGVRRSGSDTPPALLEEYGISLADVGRHEQAIEVFRRLQQLDANNSTAKEWLARLGAERVAPD